jgi:thiopurine S-methyltransferase
MNPHQISAAGHAFWHTRWANNEIAFHEPTGNPLLLRHWNALALPPGARVFVPLCGKSRDLAWLASQGFRVAGAELSREAVEAFFAESLLSPTIESLGPLTRYQAENIEIFAGDIFQLSPSTLGHVQAVYDRAALVAIPGNLRPLYAHHIASITGRAPQLVITYAYGQAAHSGPPFAIPEEELRRLYNPDYTLTLLSRTPVPGGLRGLCPAQEHAWLFSP